MASLIHEPKRPLLPWRVDYFERRKRYTRRFPTKRLAEAFIGDVARGQRVAQTDRQTLTEWLALWVTETGLTWEPRTRRDRASYADRFIVPELGNMRLTEIGRADVRSWRAGLLRGGASTYTADRALSVLSAALGEAVKEELIRVNPCIGVGRLPRNVNRRTPASVAEVEAVRSMMRLPADKALVSLMAYAGLRPSEARALQWGDVGEHSLVVRSALSSEGQEKRTKTGSIRSVPIIAPLAEDLEALARDDAKSEPVALVLGQPVDHRGWTKRVWRPARLAAGTSITPYALRHTFAALLIAEGRNAWQVASLMGHANPQMVIHVYGHLFADAELRTDPQPMEAAALAARHEASP